MVDDLVNSLFRCASDPLNWEKSLDLFCTEFDLNSAVKIQFDDIEEQRLLTTYSSFFRKPENRHFVDHMNRGNDESDHETYRMMFQAKPRTFYTETEANEQFRQRDVPSSFMFDELRKSGIVERLAASLNNSGPWLDFLTIQVRSEREIITLKSDPKMQLVLSCFAGATDLSRAFAQLRERYNAALAVLDLFGLGVALTTSNGEAILTNKEAKRILDLDDGVALNRRNILTFFDNDASVQFHHSCKQIFALRSPAPTIVPRPSGKHALILSVHGLEDSIGELEPNLRCACVILIDPCGPNRINGKGLGLLGGLTEAEQEVLELLLTGETIASISNIRDTSQNTVRTQIKVVFQKLRCKSQQDLIRLAANATLPTLSDS